MKYVLLFIYLLLCLNHTGYTQNLVNNPSFEEYNMCPISFSSINPPNTITGPTTTVLYWSRPNGATSDYHNSCAASIVSVPANMEGYQPAKTGSAYAGIFSFNSVTIHTDDYREYIQSKLLSPLVAGKTYFVNYWLSHSDSSKIATDKQGVLFYSDSINTPMSYSVLSSYTPSLETPAGLIYNDKANWTSVSGWYTASGGERWMILGNFAPYSQLTVEGDETVLNSNAYYYYDDICVLDMDGTPENTYIHHLTLCVDEGVEINWEDSTDYHLLWDNGDTARIRFITLPGTYWVKYADKNNCVFYIDTFIAEAAPVDTVSLFLGNDTLICANQALTLSIEDERFNQYTWSTGTTGSSIDIDEAGKYYVTATSGCYFGSDTIEVTTFPSPEVMLPGDTLLCEGTTLSVGIQQEGLGYSWSTGAHSCCIDITAAGTYSLEVENVCGDRARDEFTVSFANCDDCLAFPNAFSPNADGRNDVFMPVTNGCIIGIYKLYIYNRWGQLVFLSNKIEDGWDGTISDVPAGTGTYYFYVEAYPVITSQPVIILKGDVTLLR